MLNAQAEDFGLDPWDPCRVEELLAAIPDYAKGYVPDCDQKVLIPMAPSNPENPVFLMGIFTLDALDIECEPVFNEPVTVCINYSTCPGPCPPDYDGCFGAPCKF